MINIGSIQIVWITKEDNEPSQSEYKLFIVWTKIWIHFELFGFCFDFEGSVLPFEFSLRKRESSDSVFILDLFSLERDLRPGEEKSATENKLDAKFVSAAVSAVNPGRRIEKRISLQPLQCQAVPFQSRTGLCTGNTGPLLPESLGPLKYSGRPQPYFSVAHSKGSQCSFPLMNFFMRECCSNCHTFYFQSRPHDSLSHSVGQTRC